MAGKIEQFDPIEQLSASLNAYEIVMAETEAILPRMRFTFERIERELAAVREIRDRLDYYTEAEAADQFKLKVTHLAALRRDHNLPHVRFGGEVRYNRQHLDQITTFFDSRNAGKKPMLRAA